MPTVGVLTLELHLEDSHSLKDKRHHIRSLQDRLRHHLNVAVAEIDFQDTWQQSVIAVVTVSSSHTNAEQILQTAEEDAVRLLGRAVTSATVEWLT